MDLGIELALARSAALTCGEIQRSFSHKHKRIEQKPDASPVSEVDTACEEVLREALLKYFPTDGFLGEETGDHHGSSGRRWVVDPIDGTRPYLRNIPTYGTLIGLEIDEVPVLGIMHLVGLGLTCYGALGMGAFINDQPIHVSSAPTLSVAMGSGLGFIEKAGTSEADNLLTVLGTCDYAYGFMDSYSYVKICCGDLDASVNLLDKPWDCAAAAAIITEAGGSYSDREGNKSIYNGSFVLSNGLLHSEIITLLNT